MDIKILVLVFCLVLLGGGGLFLFLFSALFVFVVALVFVLRLVKGLELGPVQFPLQVRRVSSFWSLRACMDGWTSKVLCSPFFRLVVVVVVALVVLLVHVLDGRPGVTFVVDWA